MDTSRSRSPSIRRSPSPRPPSYAAAGLDPSASLHPHLHQTTAGQAYDTQQLLTTSSATQQFPQQTSLDPNFLSSSSPNLLQQRSPSPQFGTVGNTETLDLSNGADDFNSLFAADATLGQGQAIDPSFLSDSLDPQLFSTQPQTGSVNPSDLMNAMAPPVHSPTPPHLLPGMNQRSPSPHASPNNIQGAFRSPSHSRNTSLDPSAAYGQLQNNADWANVQTFRGHRRSPSDTHSDVSSAHASPFLAHNDSFESDNPSPLLPAQQDPSLYQDVMQFGQFDLNDDHSHISPGHSPRISPQLIPQQTLPQFQPGSFGLDPSLNPHFVQTGMAYPGQGAEPFPTINQSMPVPEFGQADTMSPPEINIDFAPPSRQASFEPAQQEHRADALSPPDRSRGRRERAQSDPFGGASSRASTPGLGPTVHRSLSPSAAKSRSPSPSSKSSRRSSTSSVPNRDVILNLADPSRPNSNPLGDGSAAKRTQKHPATFQCSLCPKRFTRAYNLRSHLRTHTDERPFVCSVCGKAFARQHDRKRHEGLHSGEKKFVCKGSLKSGGAWGCGRRFARADALGRHFRSEAGRVCIRPLLEEEAAEKGHWDAQQQAQGLDANGNPNGNGMFGAVPTYPGMVPQAGTFDSAFSSTGMEGALPSQASTYGLPAALLAQYPALAGIQWDQLPAGGPEDIGDASSGGEMFDDDGSGDYGVSAGQHGQSIYAGGGGWASDYEGGR